MHEWKYLARKGSSFFIRPLAASASSACAAQLQPAASRDGPSGPRCENEAAFPEWHGGLIAVGCSEPPTPEPAPDIVCQCL